MYYKLQYFINNKAFEILNLIYFSTFTVDETLEGGDWLRGRKVTDACNHVIDEKSGMFPLAYVKIMTSPYVVIHQFDAEQNEDLQLYEGEVSKFIQK